MPYRGLGNKDCPISEDCPDKGQKHTNLSYLLFMSGRHLCLWHRWQYRSPSERHVCLYLGNITFSLGLEKNHLRNINHMIKFVALSFCPNIILQIAYFYCKRVLKIAVIFILDRNLHVSLCLNSSITLLYKPYLSPDKFMPGICFLGYLIFINSTSNVIHYYEQMCLCVCVHEIISMYLYSKFASYTHPLEPFVNSLQVQSIFSGTLLFINRMKNFEPNW